MTYLVAQVCAYCRKVYGEPVPSAIDRESTGICPSCREKS